MSSCVGDDQDLDDRVIRQLWEENQDLRHVAESLHCQLLCHFVLDSFSFAYLEPDTGGDLGSDHCSFMHESNSVEVALETFIGQDFDLDP